MQLSPLPGSNGGSVGDALSATTATMDVVSSIDKQGKFGSAGSFKLVLLVMMVFQNSATVLVGRYTRAGVPEASLYDVNHLLTIIELTKLVLSAALEFYTTGGRLWQSLETHIFQRPADALKVAVPAVLYLLQNTLLYVALSNLTAPIFQVTYQAKLVTTALVSVLMLKRSYSAQQWVCLVAISMGVAVVVLGEKKGDTAAAVAGQSSQSLMAGLTAVSIACFSSALAGVYFEFVLKNKSADNNSKMQQVPPPSLWMRNIQLAFFSVVIAVGQGLYQKGLAPATQPYLHGFSAWAWILVALQAGGGMLVAAVIKYADNVLKGLATGVSVVLATVLSTVFFHTPLTSQFALGAGLILTAVYLFSNPLPAFVKKGVRKDAEMKSILPK
jgi:UDP-sugar transporter A1/2/3